MTRLLKIYIFLYNSYKLYQSHFWQYLRFHHSDLFIPDGIRCHVSSCLLFFSCRIKSCYISTYRSYPCIVPFLGYHKLVCTTSCPFVSFEMWRIALVFFDESALSDLKLITKFCLQLVLYLTRKKRNEYNENLVSYIDSKNNWLTNVFELEVSGDCINVFDIISNII